MATRDSLIIGLDLGTTACKAVAMDARGQAKAAASRSYPLHARGDAAEQDVTDVAAAAFHAVRDVVNQVGADRVKAIALSGAMHSLAAIDAHDSPLG